MMFSVFLIMSEAIQKGEGHFLFLPELLERLGRFLQILYLSQKLLSEY